MNAGGDAIDCMGNGVGGKTNPNSEETMKHMCACVYYDVNYVTFYGIFQMAEIILSILGIICVNIPKHTGCVFLYGDTYAYYEYITGVCITGSVVWYFLHLFAIPRKCGCICWSIVELVWLGVLSLNFVIVSPLMLTRACFQGAYKAAGAFGSICLVILLIHGVFVCRAYLQQRERNTRSAMMMTDMKQQPTA